MISHSDDELFSLLDSIMNYLGTRTCAQEKKVFSIPGIHFHYYTMKLGEMKIMEVILRVRPY